MGIRHDLTGQRFNRLVVVEYRGRTPSGKHSLWFCRCDCGNELTTRAGDLKSGNTKSCGCWQRDASIRFATKHGQYGTPLYTCWVNMIKRTTEPNNPTYKHYGGRGITVCPAWRESFEAFAADMGPSFREDLTLDRIDVNGHYEPANCRWATRTVQARNKRNNFVVTWHGQTMVLAEWAELLGLKYDTLRMRLRQYGWPAERALTVDVDPEVLSAVFGEDVANIERSRPRIAEVCSEGHDLTSPGAKASNRGCRACKNRKQLERRAREKAA